MLKNYVLDTNVILHDAQAIFKFEDNMVVLPMVVLEEIDKFKKEQNELGRNARQFTRYMDVLREKGKLTEGISINDSGGKLCVKDFVASSMMTGAINDLDLSQNDNKILATASYFRRFGSTVLVTKDINLRVRADICDVVAEDYKNDKLQTEEIYSGIQQLTVTYDLIDKVYDDKFLNKDDIEMEPYPNQCFVLKCLKQSALVRYDSEAKRYRLLPQNQKTVDIQPRNTEQQFALDLLRDENISLVSMIGKAGSGKTLMALAAGLHLVLEQQRYNKILLLKPIVAMDNNHELGFLPGSMQEKLSPWMSSYSDNIEYIMSAYMKDEDKPKKGKTGKKETNVYNEKQPAKANPIYELMELGLLEMGSLEHIRGRSLPNQFIIIDECQNLSKSALKTVITRVGEGTKIVLLGDISQIDAPYLDSQSNGLTICVEAFKMKECAGHITMRKSERSKLAEIASEVL